MKFRRILIMALSFMVIGSSLLFNTPPLHAAVKTTAIQKYFAEGIISLKMVHVMPTDEGKQVTYQLSIHNNTGKPLSLNDYWVRITSSNGTRLISQLHPDDKKLKSIPAKGSVDLRYYVNVSDSTNINSLVLKFVKFDFSYSGYERTLVQFNGPYNYNLSTAYNKTRAFKYNSLYLETSLDQLNAAKVENDYTGDLDFTFKNISKTSAKLQNVGLGILTKGQLLVPVELDADSTAKLATLSPYKSIKVHGTFAVSSELGNDKWKLVLYQKISGAEGQPDNLTPLAMYNAPTSASSAPSTATDTISYSSTEGKYQFQMAQVYRYPWDGNDLLVAEVTVKNTSISVQGIPKLDGEFNVDQSSKVPGSTLVTDQVSNIQPSGSVKVLFYAQIPYSYGAKTVSLKLIDKTNATKVTAIGEIKKSALPLTPAMQEAGNSYSFKEVGRSTDFKIYDTRVYVGEGTKVLSVRAHLKNTQMRFTQVSKLKGFFKTVDGVYIPAQSAETTGSISTDAFSEVQFWATVPQTMNLTNAQLVIGEAVKDSSFAVGDEAATGFINAVSFPIPADKLETDSFANIDLSPYELNIKNLNTTLDLKNLKVKFDYDLTKDTVVQKNPDGRKVLITLEYEGGKISYSQELTINGTDNNSLKLGGGTIDIVRDYTDLKEQFNTQNKYTFNIYELFQGHKKLLVSKKVDWYVITDFIQDH